MPNSDRANMLAVKLLLRQNINSIRTDPFHLNCNGGIVVDSIQHYAACVGKLPGDFLAESISDCVAIKRYGKHLILYNRDVLCSARKRWSVAHEIGHICCRHTSDGPLQEAEANAFAGELLIPAVIAEELICKGKIKAPLDICTIFGVSASAAAIRFSQLFSRARTAQDEELLHRYLPAIEEELSGPVISIPHRYSSEQAPIVL